MAEYQIPNAGSSPGGRGYADLVNILTKEIFEIKPNNQSGILAGQAEAAHYVTMANANCLQPNGVWHLGSTYATRILPWPLDPNFSLKAELKVNGVIVYEKVPRSSNPIPNPVAIPQNIFDKLKELVRQLGQNPPNPDLVILRFLKANPEVKMF